MARQKRNVAIKKLEENKVLQVKTEDDGSQFLVFPWMPGTQLPYKSLPRIAKLQNEMLAGAFGEVLKDCSLYGVDTIKTRRQTQKRTVDGVEIRDEYEEDQDFAMKLRDAYAGFPVGKWVLQYLSI